MRLDGTFRPIAREAAMEVQVRVESPGMEEAVEELPDLPLLTGRVVRTLLTLSNGGLVVDLAREPMSGSEPGSGCLERLRFNARMPGLTVIAAALSRATGWHPVPGRQSGTVDLVDAHRRPRLCVRMDAQRSWLEIDICALERPIASPAGRRREPGRIRRTEPQGDVFAWLETLKKRCKSIVEEDDIEILECSREGRPPLRLALHTVAEEERRRGNSFNSRTMHGTRQG